jgi:hypothetical protein
MLGWINLVRLEQIRLVCKKESLKIDYLATLGIEMPALCGMASRNSSSLYSERLLASPLLASSY